MSVMNQPTSLSIAQNRKRGEARKRRPMAHIDYGWPHYRTGTERCICVETCCHDENNGCICKNCICRIHPEAHNDTSIQYATPGQSREAQLQPA